MKKLMIAAAVAAMVGGAYAGCEIVKPATPNVDCATVYDVTFNLKTTKCVCKTVKAVKAKDGDACGIGGTVGTDAKCDSWREITTYKVNGVLFTCACGCEGDGDAAENVFATLVGNSAEVYGEEETTLDNGGTSIAVTGNQLFWIAKEKVTLDSLLKLDWIGRIGKKKTQVEVAGTFGDSITVAGYGTYDVKNERVKSISGHAAGTIVAPADCGGTVENGDFVASTSPCPAYELCSDAPLADPKDTFASGTWTLKYNASKSKAFAKGQFFGKVVSKAVANYYAIALSTPTE